MGFFTKKKEMPPPPKPKSEFLTRIADNLEGYAERQREALALRREEDLAHDKRKLERQARQALQRQQQCYAQGYGHGYHAAEQPNYDQGWQDRGMHERHYGAGKENKVTVYAGGGNRQQGNGDDRYGHQGYRGHGYGQHDLDTDESETSTDDTSEGSSRPHHRRRHHGHHCSHGHRRHHRD